MEGKQFCSLPPSEDKIENVVVRKSYAIPFLNKTTATTGASNITEESDFREKQSHQITDGEMEAEGTSLVRKAATQVIFLKILFI